MKKRPRPAPRFISIQDVKYVFGCLEDTDFPVCLK